MTENVSSHVFLTALRDWLQDLRRYVFHGGSKKLRPIQQQLLNVFVPTLEPNIQLVVERQLKESFYMQFWHGGRISPFFFRDPKLPPELRLPDPAFADRLYKIEMFVDGRKQHAHVTFYQGRIFSLEFKKPFKFYKGKDVRFGAVTLGKPKQTLTNAIDRREHGTGEI